jgi:protein ImuB
VDGGADEIKLSLTLENAPLHMCTLRLPLPMRDPKVFLKLLQLELAACPPAAPILKILIELKPVEPQTEQHNLFIALTPAPEKLEITLSKLSNLVGPENVGTPALLDTHRPEAFQMNLFSAARGAISSPLPARPALVLRRYRPKHAQVVKKDERPAYLRSSSLQGRVVACLGPWRMSRDWWLAEFWDRDEWDIALSDGALFRVHEDRGPIEFRFLPKGHPPKSFAPDLASPPTLHYASGHGR